jgi:hypothetical protein
MDGPGGLACFPRGMARDVRGTRYDDGLAHCVPAQSVAGQSLNHHAPHDSRRGASFQQPLLTQLPIRSQDRSLPTNALACRDPRSWCRRIADPVTQAAVSVSDWRAGSSAGDLLTHPRRTSDPADLGVCLTDNTEVNDSSPRSTRTVTSVEAVSLRPVRRGTPPTETRSHSATDSRVCQLAEHLGTLDRPRPPPPGIGPAHLGVEVRDETLLFVPTQGDAVEWSATACRVAARSGGRTSPRSGRTSLSPQRGRGRCHSVATPLSHRLRRLLAFSVVPTVHAWSLSEYS